jgi:uncharacterized protein involved in outer membrane biogenesis
MPLKITRRIRLLVIVLAGLLLAYAAFGFWLVPRLVRGQVEDFSAQHWQRKPALGDVTFNPFTLTLELDSFDFRDSKGEPLLAFDRLRVNFDISSIWRRGASFREIQLDRPVGRVLVRADGSLNLAELAAPFAAPAGAPSEPESAPARLFIDRFRIVNGTVGFEDHARSTPFRARLQPVNFELVDFGTTGDSDNQYSLQATSTEGEKFRWSGSFALSPLQSRGDFELADVQARTLWSYLQESLGFELAGGQVAVKGGYLFVAGEPEMTLDLTLARVDVGGLKLRARGGAEDWIELGHLEIGDARAQLAKRRLDIGSIRLAEGTVKARRAADGTVNLMALAEPPAALPKDSSMAAEAPTLTTSAPAPVASWTVNAPDVAVESLRVEINDAFVKPAATLLVTPLNLRVRGFSTAPGQQLEVSGDLALESGGRLSLQATGSAAEKTFKGKLKLDGLNLTALQPYLGTYTQMTLLSGSLGADLDADFRPGAWRVAGDLRSSKLHTVDNALREDFVKWEQLTLSGIEYQSSPESLRIADISARAPYVRFIIAPDQTTNVSKVLAMPASAPGPVQTVKGAGQEATGAARPMAISIGRVKVDNGSANFADFWITPNYAVSLQQLGGSVTGLSSRKDSRARMALKGKIDRYAPVEIAGELNLLSASLFTDLRVKFEGVELTSVTPYSGRFAGYRIEKGKLSVDVRYLVENRKLDAEQRFIVDQLTLGERVDSPDAVKLPLRLAVALLKDRNGVIDLGLPVSGSLDDPKFRIGPIVWKAFVNLLAGVATSPFKLLGGMFGGGEEVNLIDFAPGSATLDAAAAEKLASLTKALHERPQLALEVPATWSPDADSAELGARQLEAKLQALVLARKEGADALMDPARRFELLLALYRADKANAALPPGAHALQELRAKERAAAALASANGELESALRPGIDALEPALKTLAQERARAIQDALLGSGQVEPARVFMLAAEARPAEAGKVRVALSLK